ncbi:MAG: hypothetical protein KIT84_32390 [Labilithrix sp.]|nr:hypothetical protein [Labilithrix sp.]MCW5815773.1 hypothetical protein [Labilithrix sp.]
MNRNVKGILFADYVRMMRGKKDVDWSMFVRREDLFYFRSQVEPDDWYPMETFERFGNVILAEIANGSLEAVRQWGRVSVDALVAANPNLLAAGDPVETMMRFRVQRATYFDFEALEVPSLAPGHAEVVIHYYMGAKAEEAASYQTMGFFERLVEVAGGADVVAKFTSCSWTRGARTVLTLDWT